MNLSELEAYILSKDSVQRCAIAQWRYVRYTVYASMFAAVQDTRNGMLLTVVGRFPHYETEYKEITPSTENDARYYTDANFETLPDHVVKAMIDYAYRETLRRIPLPQTPNPRYEDVPYFAIWPMTPIGEADPTTKKRGITKEIVKQAVQNREVVDYGYWEVRHSDPDADVPQPQGEGRFDAVPYRIFQDENRLAMLKKLLKMQKKSEEKKKKQ